MNHVEGTWYNDSRLIPTGQLKILSTDVQQSESMIHVKILAEDEIGVVWDLTRPIFTWEIIYESLPEFLHAHYWFKTTWHKEYVILANSQEEALNKLKLQQAGTYYGKLDVTFTGITGPKCKRALAQSKQGT